MAKNGLGGIRVLVVATSGRLCAVPLLHVVEIMRPLPIETLAGAPPFVRGVSILRGVPTPVVDLGVLLGSVDAAIYPGMAARCVTLRLGERQAALFVGAVYGVRELDARTIRELPPLLQGVSNDFIEVIGTLDAQMLVVLRSGWRLPDAVWESLAGLGSPHVTQSKVVVSTTSESAR